MYTVLAVGALALNPYMSSEDCEYNSKTCRFTARVKHNRIKLYDMNSTVDSTWRTATSTLYCGENDCSRELHVMLGESVTWSKGEELSQQQGVSKAIVDSISEGTTDSMSSNIGINAEIFSAGVELGQEFHKSTTHENSLETSFSTGVSVTYSLSKEHSLNREEVVICSAKANEGIKLLARTNELHVEAFLCIPYEEDSDKPGWYSANCDYIRIVMRPFSGNSISADMKCSTEKSKVKEPLKNACSMFNDTCDLNNPCCSNLSCVKSDPTQLSGRCYNTNKPDTQTTSNRLGYPSNTTGNINCIPFDGVCSHSDTCCGNTYCYYGNPSWANGRCYNRN
ncbi:Uncharacterized protein FWK35_00014710 [Aphis craccivora]|uniref:Uncharacterized protein n=1 Tax=Aphis craccivora TaxID=307492 RepID=A0A6G0YHY6_APHCR|nr:Uncharacterized protein FWK35_00014710 [Aphis craccivora]